MATINKAIVDNNYEITYIKEEPSTRASTVVAKTFESYESGYDSGNRYFKEWLTSLYCRFSYNPSTGNITYIYDPQLSVEFVGWVVLLVQVFMMFQQVKDKQVDYLWNILVRIKLERSLRFMIIYHH